MSEARKKMLDKVRAMLNNSGRTEEEMMAFLAKARELMATYEISESELEEETEGAKIHKTGMSDPYDIKKGLYVAIGRFTRCRAWEGTAKNWGVTFCGLESDVIFAQWLLETLQRFVMRALREFQKQRSLKGMTNSNYTSASFAVGCTARINEKLMELAPAEKATDNALIVAELAKNGIVLRKKSNSREVHQGSAKDGYKAGNSARFDRPVGQSGGVKRLK